MTKQNGQVEENRPVQYDKLEDAMRRLDEVVAALDRENADLEEALRLYEEGVRLVAFCNRRLEDAQRTIQMLKINTEGEPCEVPFEGKA